MPIYILYFITYKLVSLHQSHQYFVAFNAFDINSENV